MKWILSGVTALASVALAGSALAADLPYRSAPPMVSSFAPFPVFTWTGFYVGLNAGYGFGTGKDKDVPTIIGVPANGLLVTPGGAPTAGIVAFGNKASNEGFTGGGQIGYNWQLTPGSGFVVGVEADAQFVDFGRDRNRFSTLAGTGPGPGILFFNPNGISGLDYFGTVRGRLGYAFDRTLVYGSGGFAYGSGGGREFGLPNASEDKFQTGWAAGAGVEYALPTDSFLNFFRSSAVTLRVEGMYVNLDNGNRNTGAFAVDNLGHQAFIGRDGALLSGPVAERNETEFAVVRAGLNYKFGSY